MLYEVITYIMHEIESFATDLRKRAEIAHYQPLIDWSDRLVREVRSFDMERLPLTLEEFPRIVITSYSIHYTKLYENHC